MLIRPHPEYCLQHKTPVPERTISWIEINKIYRDGQVAGALTLWWLPKETVHSGENMVAISSVAWNLARANPGCCTWDRAILDTVRDGCQVAGEQLCRRDLGVLVRADQHEPAARPGSQRGKTYFGGIKYSIDKLVKWGDSPDLYNIEVSSSWILFVVLDSAI